MDKDSTLYQLISKINRLKEMKDEFDELYDVFGGLFERLGDDERVELEKLVTPDFLLTDLEHSGAGEAWAESIHYHKIIDLESLVK